MGKLIVIEGVDSSGKATQTKKLFERLNDEGINVCAIEFPNYKSKSSELVKMYLNGEFGENANDTDPYMASVFFAADRAASFKKEYNKMLKDCDVLIADRYTTSNMIHQASKINETDKKEEFLHWVSDFEYSKLSLPKPDLTIFLDMPVKFAMKLMAERKNKINNSSVKDIHESDENYLNESYNNACFVAERNNWTHIMCVDGERIKTIDEISDEIYSYVKNIL